MIEENFHCRPDSDLNSDNVKVVDVGVDVGIRDELQEMYPDIDFLFMSEKEYDDAILGVAESIGNEPTIAYDYDKVIDASKKMGMSYEEAVEYFHYNQIGAYVGKQTPIFITKPEQ